MKVRTQFFVALGAAVLLFVIAFATGRRFRAQEDPDPRASSFATGRMGVSGLYEALDRLGVTTDRWRERPVLFAGRTTGDSAGSAATFAVIAPSRPVSSRERVAIIRMLTVTTGSNLLLAGESRESLMPCLGYALEVNVFDSVRVARPRTPVDSAAAWVHAHLVPLSDSARKAMDAEEPSMDGAAGPCSWPMPRCCATANCGARRPAHLSSGRYGRWALASPSTSTITGTGAAGRWRGWRWTGACGTRWGG